MPHVLRRLIHDRRGATAIEYALIAAVVALIAIVGVTAFGGSMQSMWSYVGSTINGALN